MHVFIDAPHQSAFENIDICCILFAFAGQVCSCLINGFALFSFTFSPNIRLELLFFLTSCTCCSFLSLNASEVQEKASPEVECVTIGIIF